MDWRQCIHGCGLSLPWEIHSSNQSLRHLIPVYTCMSDCTCHFLVISRELIGLPLLYLQGASVISHWNRLDCQSLNSCLFKLGHNICGCCINTAQISDKVNISSRPSVDRHQCICDQRQCICGCRLSLPRAIYSGNCMQLASDVPYLCTLIRLQIADYY